MRMLCRQFARSGEIIKGSFADKTWLKFNFETIGPFIREKIRRVLHKTRLKQDVNFPYTAISRKVVGKSARDNPERHCGWF